MPKIIKIKTISLRGKTYKVIPDERYYNNKMKDGDVLGSHIFYEGNYYKIISC